jgi:AraC family transcriptional regulator
MRVQNIAAGEGWQLRRIACYADDATPAFEEQHDAHVIAIVERGSFTYHGVERRQLLHPGAILTANAGVCYSCGHAHAGGDTCLALRLEAPLYEAVSLAMSGREDFKFKAAAQPATRALLPTVAGLLYALKHNTVEEHVFAFASAVLESASGQVSHQKASALDLQRVEACLRYIEQKFDEPLTLDDLARQAECSRFHLCRIVKTICGTTPYQYLLQFRMKRAATLLQGSKRPVTDIALSIGFGDLSTFNATFKSVYGRTPTQFRNHS